MARSGWRGILAYVSNGAIWNAESADGTMLRVYELGGSGPALLIAHATGLGGREVRLSSVTSAQAPTIVAVGAGDDGPNPSVLGGLIADAIGGRLIRYRSLGHFGPFQDPLTVAQDLTEHALHLPGSGS